MSTDLVRPFTGLLDVQTGELLPATVENAAKVLHAARAMKEMVNGIVEETTAYLAAEAAHRGTKTLHDGDHTVTLTGGESVDYDAHDLMDLLREAGCPEDRIDAAVVATVTYKIDRSVLRQLQVNKDYAAAIDLAKREVVKPWRASIKSRRRPDAE